MISFHIFKLCTDIETSSKNSSPVRNRKHNFTIPSPWRIHQDIFIHPCLCLFSQSFKSNFSRCSGLYRIFNKIAFSYYGKHDFPPPNIIKTKDNQPSPTSQEVARTKTPFSLVKYFVF